MLLAIALFLAALQDYDALTNNQVEVTNFNPEPFTGLAVDSAGNLWAVNPYGNTVIRHNAAKFANPAGASPSANLIIPTGLNPVSVAIWEPVGMARKVIAVCAGTHGAFLHDAATGQVEDFVQFQAEHELGAPLIGPVAEGGDIVIDRQNQKAYVSCPGMETVLQIELNPSSASFFEVTAAYYLDCGQRPGPLVLDLRTPAPEDNRILVAMMVTGNNSIFLPPKIPDPTGTTPEISAPNSVGTVADLEVEFPSGTVASQERLPDEDVYAIVPSTGAITPWVTGVGSLLFEMERNPKNGGLWILTQESNNKDKTLDTEPKIRGQVATNLLALVLDTGAGPFQPIASLDLDDHDQNPTTPYNVLAVLNQPHAIAFSTGAFANNGLGFVASPFSDNIVIVSEFGTRFPNILYQLPAGAQPFDLTLVGAERFLAALCLGTMTIELFDRATQTHAASFELGLDPTPDQVQRGRAVFSNGLFSKDGRTSCASCHPRGRSDELGWSIEGEPLDHKDVMLTQSLWSISDTFPHHWRGERDLKDFQKAFVGLLGADPDGSGTPTEEPTDAQMDDFIAFMQSLQAPANPIQNPRRILDGNRRSVLDEVEEANLASILNTSDPIIGQSRFSTVPNFSNVTCLFCHSGETGSSGNFSVEVGSAIPRESKIENAHLRQLQHRDFDIEIIHDPNFPANPSRTLFVNQNGFGATHKGGGGAQFDSDLSNGTSIFDFVFNTDVFRAAFTLNDLANVFRFVDQFDQGIHPGVHRAWFADSTTPTSVLDDIFNILIGPFDSDWCDVVAFGRVDLDLSGPMGLSPIRLSLVQTASGPRFAADSPSLPFVEWSIVRFLIENDWAELAVMGVPPGNGIRVGVDFDRDALRNLASAELDPWNPDVNADGKPDGYNLADTTPPGVVEHALDFVTTRIAKYHIRFTEDVRYRVEYIAPGMASPLVFHSVRGNQAAGIYDYADVDTFVLTHSNPSGAGLNPPGTPGNPVNFAVTVFPEDRNGNKVTNGLGQEIGIPLTAFTPLEGDDQDGIIFLEFSHVDSIVETTIPPGAVVPVGFEAHAVRITMRENETFPGSSNFVPMVNASAFVTLGLENQSPSPGEPDFTLVDVTSPDFHTLHPTAFSTAAGLYTGLSNYVVSPLTTDGTGGTTMVFAFRNLLPGQDIKVAVQGILRAENPGGPPPILYTDTSINEIQALGLEDSMEVRIERP